MRGYRTPLGLISRFEDQFEADGRGGYIYRLNGNGRPIPVGRDERVRFIGQYASRIVLVWGAMMVALMLFFLTFYWKVVTTSKVLPSSVIFSDPFFYEGIILIGLPATTLIYWLGEAPARALKDRAALGPEPSRDEKRAIRFGKLSYRQLALLALVGGSSYEYIAHDNWDRRWVFVPVLAVAVPAVQAFRKWRFESRHTAR